MSSLMSSSGRGGLDRVRLELGGIDLRRTVFPVDLAATPTYPIPTRVARTTRAVGLGIWWDWSRGITHAPRDPAQCLTRFIRLDGAPAGDVARFAMHYGVLGLCGHRKPAGHHAGCAHQDP